MVEILMRHIENPIIVLALIGLIAIAIICYSIVKIKSPVSYESNYENEGQENNLSQVLYRINESGLLIDDKAKLMSEAIAKWDGSK